MGLCGGVLKDSVVTTSSQEEESRLSRGSSPCLNSMAEPIIERTVLLNSGYRMPVIGLGTWLTDDEAPLELAFDAAIQAGYRLVDTAVPYYNEEFLGTFLQRHFAEGTVKREDMFIVTKLPMNGMRSDSVKYFCMRSLKALQLDYLDLYLIHSPTYTKRTKDDYEIFPIQDGKVDFGDNVDLTETWKAMEKLVEEGLVRSLGLSNFNSHQIKRIYDNAIIKPANLQVECHAYLQQQELHELCMNLGISFTAFSPLGNRGLVAGMKKYHIDIEPRPNLLDDQRLQPLCEKHNKSKAQILLRFLLQRNICVIPKSSNTERVKENIQVFDFTLSDDDMDLLKSMNKNLRYIDFNFFGMPEHPEYPFNIPY